MTQEQGKQPSYEEWINNWRNNNNPYLKCKEASELMQKSFPELKLIRGHVLTERGKRPHWWLLDTQENIIDPTASQFQAIGCYYPWDETQLEPTGKCPNCGELCYDYKTLCSENCEIEYKAYVESSGW